LAAEKHGARLGTQALALARAAELLAEVFAEPLPHLLGMGFAPAALNVVGHALEAHGP